MVECIRWHVRCRFLWGREKGLQCVEIPTPELQRREDERLGAWSLSLSLINQDSRSIFVDGRGESIMDFTWVIPSAAERLGN